MLIRNLRKHEAKIATMNGVQNWSELQSKYNINKKNIKFFKEMIHDYRIVIKDSKNKHIILCNIPHLVTNLDSIYENDAKDIKSYEEILSLHINGLNADKSHVQLEHNINKGKFLIGLGNNNLELLINNPLLEDKGIKSLFLLAFAKYDLKAWSCYEENKKGLFKNINITDDDILLFSLNKDYGTFKNNINKILDKKLLENTLIFNEENIANNIIPKRALQNNNNLFNFTKYIDFKKILLDENRYQVDGLTVNLKTRVKDLQEFNLWSVSNLLVAEELFTKFLNYNVAVTMSYKIENKEELKNNLINKIENFEYQWQWDNFNELLIKRENTKLNFNEELVMKEVKIITNKIMLDKELSLNLESSLEKPKRKKI